MTHVEVNGLFVAYRDVGEGPPLVLLHGFLSDSRCWGAQLAGLSDNFRVLAWDAPGAGSSSDPPETFTTADRARCLARFLDVVGIERPGVLGLSWGGILAQPFYGLYPDRVLALILCDTYAGWKGSLPEVACNKRLERCLLESLLPAGEFVPRWVPEFFTESASDDLKGEMSARPACPWPGTLAPIQVAYAVSETSLAVASGVLGARDTHRILHKSHIRQTDC